jgi:hypothetical protein
MLCLLNLLIHPVEAEKLAIPRRTEMHNPFLRWVPSVEALLLNYMANADSSSSGGKHFNNFHCLEKDLHCTKLLLICSRFFTVGFSVGTGSPNCDACSTCVPICVSACTKVFILSLFVIDLGFYLLSVFNSLAVKFVLVYNKIWSLWSEVMWV